MRVSNTVLAPAEMAAQRAVASAVTAIAATHPSMPSPTHDQQHQKTRPSPSSLEVPSPPVSKVPALLKRPSLLGHQQQFEMRHATLDDLPAVMQFEQDLAMETEGHGIDEAALRLGCRGALDAPHLAHVALAHHRDRPNELVGYLALSKQWSVWHGGFMNYILSVFVHKSCRGSGLFTGIFSHAQNMVRGDRMSIGVRLNVASDNAQAIRAYEKHGMFIEPLDLYKWVKPADKLPAALGTAELPSADPILPKMFPNGTPWTLRRAESRDLDKLVQIQIAAAKEMNVSCSEESIRRGVAMPWAEPYTARVYVAELDGKIIASTFVTNEWNTWKGGIIYWLSGCYTHPDHRAKGVMKSLYQFCMEEVNREGCAAGIRMCVPRGNEAAARAAMSVGLQKEPYNLMCWIDDAGAGSRKFVK